MKNQRGFTLLELMVAVAMIAIVASLAMPSWREFVANRRAAGASRDVYNALQHTRMLAIKEGRTASVQFVEDTTTSEENDFLTLRVGFDSGTVPVDDAFEIDATELELEVKLPEGVVGTVNSNPMQYNSRGILNGGGNGTISVWSALTNREYQVVVNNLGTLRQAAGTHSEGS